jgi:hypothetical protein
VASEGKLATTDATPKLPINILKASKLDRVNLFILPPFFPEQISGTIIAYKKRPDGVNIVNLELILYVKLTFMSGRNFRREV